MEKQPRLIIYTAAGGVIINEDASQVLLLIRPTRDEVRLPKGHIEPGETPEQTALREVAEETGYDDVEIIRSLGEQLVAFPVKNKIVRRTEHYYLMRALSEHQSPRPHLDSAQFFSIWVTWDDAFKSLTFEAEIEWLRRARAILEETNGTTNA